MKINHDIELKFIDYLNKHDIPYPLKCMRWAFGGDYELKDPRDMYAKWNGKHSKLGFISHDETILNAFKFICLCYKAHQISKVNNRMVKGLNKLNGMVSGSVIKVFKRRKK